MIIITFPGTASLFFPDKVDVDDAVLDALVDRINWYRGQRNIVRFSYYGPGIDSLNRYTGQVTIVDSYGVTELGFITRGYFAPLEGNLSEYTIAVCRDCDSLHWQDSDDLITAHNGREEYLTCCTEDYTYCDHCGEFHRETARVAGVGDVCHVCLNQSGDYFHCDHCNQWHEIENLVSTEWNTYCSDCVDSMIMRGNWHYDRNGELQTEPDNGFEGIEIYGYGRIKDVNGHLELSWPETVHRFGAEMEFLGRGSDGDSLQEGMGDRWILTEDSTVTAELVSACLTSGELRKALKSAADGVYKGGWNGGSKAGNHIHCDSRMLTPREWWDLAVYCQAHSNVLDMFAEGNRDYANWHKLTVDSYPEFVRACEGKGSYYRNVGLYPTGETVEFRCLRTGDSTQCQANLMLVKRLIALARLPESHRPDTGEDLRDWLCGDKYIARVARAKGISYGKASYCYATAWRDYTSCPTVKVRQVGYAED